MKETNLNMLFQSMIINFAHLITPKIQTKDQFIQTVQKTYDKANPKTALFIESVKNSTFETIRLNETRSSILFNQ